MGFESKDKLKCIDDEGACGGLTKGKIYTFKEVDRFHWPANGIVVEEINGYVYPHWRFMKM